MDDAEGAGIGVIDPDLFLGEPVFEQLVFHPLIRQRTRRIEPQRLEIAGQHLHGRNATGLDRLDELGAGGEWKVIAAPQPEALGIGQVVHRGGAGRRDVDDACVRQRVLQAKSGAALLRGDLVAAFAFPACRVLHRVRLVENDHTVEARPGSEPASALNHSTICFTRDILSSRASERSVA